MLLELRIENLLLIDRAEIRFGEGLNAITGETGAGKTVLAHSLDLLMGGRARAQIVRPGADEAYVEGVFTVPAGLFDDPELAELAERLPEGSEELVLGRRVGTSGRTSAFVGGRSASAGDLRALGARLIAFYGQHEHRKLTLAAAQAAILDGFGGADQIALRDSYRAAHAEVGSLTRELESIHERDGARERDLDLLRYELGEIEAAAPDPGEEAELAAERERLRHSEGLREGAARALAAVAGDGEDAEGSVNSLLAAGEGSLAAVGGVDERLDALAERVGALAIEASDLGAELRSYLEGIDADPARLQEVEERLDALDRLRRKHGGTIDSVLEHAERCRTEIARLEGAEERSAELDRRLAEAIASRARLGRELSEERVRLVPELQERIAAELSDLAMEGAALEVVLEPVAPAVDGGEGYAASGRESVELQLATNPGMPAGPLRDAASGRRALAGDARAQRARRGRGRRHARLRRDRRRRRRQHRARRRRAVATHRRVPPGDRDHPPPAGRVTGGAPLPHREVRGRGRRSRGRRARRGRGAGRRDLPHARRRPRRRGGQPARPRVAGRLTCFGSNLPGMTTPNPPLRVRFGSISSAEMKLPNPPLRVRFGSISSA